jgi:hypothetical protein
MSQFKRRNFSSLGKTLQLRYECIIMYLQGSDSKLAKLISIFFYFLCLEISRTLLGGEYKLSVSFTKINIVNLLLALHVRCMTDDILFYSEY